MFQDVICPCGQGERDIETLAAFRTVRKDQNPEQAPSKEHRDMANSSVTDKPSNSRKIVKFLACYRENLVRPTVLMTHATAQCNFLTLYNCIIQVKINIKYQIILRFLNEVF